MSTDRELLELAAKAAGLEVWGGQWPQDDMLFVAPKRPDPSGKVTGVEWNPLTDDGDALRLAVALHIDVRFCWDGCDDQFDTVIAERSRIQADEQIGLFRLEQIDEAAATRRAIVRAAAAIGSKVTT